ncbi:unnamed protein product, partial [Mesorhabditis spiculigera]
MDPKFGFCGDPFWDDFKPLYNRTGAFPVLTECFQHTVLVAVPCFFFWFLFPVLSLQLNHSKNPPLPWTTIMSMKWLVLVMIIIDRAFVLFLGIWGKIWGPTMYRRLISFFH